MKKLFFIFCTVFFLFGCATTGEKMPKIHEGMSKQDVIEILGPPDGFQRSGEYEALKYSHRLVTGWAWDRADYNVILKNGEVVEYGMGEVRVKNLNTGILFLVPLH